MPEVKPKEVESTASIKVVGVGGAGGSAIDRMKEVGLTGVEFVAINTDAQALHHSNADAKVHIGQGLGAGGDPKKGAAAAEDSRDKISKAFDGADMAFITLGAGGGTGSGAGPIVAEEARKENVLTVGVVTKPFTFEGASRRDNAEEAIAQLRGQVDALITIPNDRLLQTIDPRTPLLETFKIADDVLRQGVQGISELITEHSLINLDFADVKAIMKDAGSALMGIGRASGENRAVLAAQQAIESPLIEVKIEGARGVLFSVAGGYNMSMSEVQDAAEVITAAVSPDANIIFGASIRPELEDEVVITVVATGFDSEYYRNLDMERKAERLIEKTRDGGDADEVVGNSKKSLTSDVDMKLEEERKVAESETQSQSQPASSDFANKQDDNMWDNIKTEQEEEDLDVPPTLREKLRNRKKRNKE